MTPPVTNEGWPQAYRIISSRFPPVGVYDEVADPADLEGVFFIEGLTNPRIREEIGVISIVPAHDRLAGPGTTPIMAAFTHFNPNGSRFSDGSFGIYYAGRTEQTAIAETVFHVAQWSLESNDPPTSFVMRVYVGELLSKPFHDLRGMQASHPEYFHHDPAMYGQAQALGAELRAGQSWGLLYDSVRLSGGECIAAFRPQALGPVCQGAHLAYVWDGSAIKDVIRLTSMGVPGV